LVGPLEVSLWLLDPASLDPIEGQNSITRLLGKGKRS
jgi:hypothetical protein